MIELDRKICEVLKTYPGLKAKDIAAKIGEDKTTINSALYGRLKYQLRQDSNYRWYLKEPTSSPENQKEPTIHNTTLSRICRYYLDCLNHEDVGGVSEFASSRYGDLSYVELPKLPMTDQDFNDIFELQSVQQLLIRIRRDRNKQMLLLGYPVRLKFIRSKTGWEGYKVEPLFLFSFQGIENIHENPSLSNELPQLNFEALSSLLNFCKIEKLESEWAF